MTISRPPNEITLAPASVSISVSLSPSGEILASVAGQTFAITSMADLRSALELKAETDRVSAKRNLEQTKTANFARSRAAYGPAFAAQVHETKSAFARRVASHHSNMPSNLPVNIENLI